MPLMESTGRLTVGDSVTLNLILWCHQRNYVFIDSNLRDGANRVEFVVDDHFWRSHLNSGECIWINLAGFILIESIDGQFECEMIFFCEKLLPPSRLSSIAALIFHVIFFRELDQHELRSVYRSNWRNKVRDIHNAHTQLRIAAYVFVQTQIETELGLFRI